MGLFDIKKGCVTCLLGLFLVNTATGCNVATVLAAIDTCTPLLTLLDPNNGGSSLSTICDDVECKINCITAAVGTCHSTEDGLFFLDPNVIKTIYRAICQNFQAASDMYGACSAFTSACVVTFLTTTDTNINNELNMGNYATFKTNMCTAMTTAKGCFSVSAGGSCSAASAQFAEDFVNVILTPSACGDTQDHAWFTTYAGDVTCSATRIGSTFAFIFVLAILSKYL